MQQEAKIYRVLFAVALCVAVLFFMLTVVFLPTQAIDVDVEVGNSAPAFVGGPIFSETMYGDEIYAQNEVYNLRAGEDANIYVRGVVQDSNGQSDIDYVNAYLYRSDLDNTCAEDGNNCYRMIGCQLSDAPNPLRQLYHCPLAMKYWMDATDTMAGSTYEAYHWQLEVVVVDIYGQSTTNTNRTLEVYSSVALDIPSTIDFGEMTLGSFTEYDENVEQTITQQGNVEQNVTVTAPDGKFFCEDGEIAIENLRWSLRDIGWDHNETTALSTKVVDTDLRVAKQTDDTTAPEKILYWNLSVPSGAGGSCSATVNILAKNAFFN